MKKNILILLIGSLLIIACGGEKTSTSNGNGKDLTAEIKKAEAKIDINKPLKQTEVLELIAAYQQYADSLPGDPKSPVYLLKASDYYGALGMHSEKCHMYKTIIDKYPDFKDADMVMYLYASSLDSDFNERTQAKKYYQQYLEKYPKSQYVNDAKSRLTTIDSLTFSELQEKIIRGELNTER